jgi:ABC-type lipoprotein export system ATPase subunit
MSQLHRCKEITKIFKTDAGEVIALNNISLDLNKGELVAVVGPSGSGKTTLLNIMGALDRPTKGEVLLEGVRIDNLSEEELVVFRRNKFSYIFQDQKPLRMLNVLENTLLPFNFFKPQNSKRNIKQEAIDILNSLGLGHRLYHLPTQLSGGENQRVAIAKALITKPSIILADEPTANLDRDNRLFVISTFKKLAKERIITIVLSTHDFEIANFADRIVYLKDGTLLKIETPSSVVHVNGI